MTIIKESVPTRYGTSTNGSGVQYPPSAVIIAVTYQSDPGGGVEEWSVVAVGSFVFVVPTDKYAGVQSVTNVMSTGQRTVKDAATPRGVLKTIPAKFV